jgi:hypothetical protein
MATEDGGHHPHLLAPDEVTRVLQECEATLRHLHQENRLSADGLRTFVALSERVRHEMERRLHPDRRRSTRETSDRRGGVAMRQP